MSYVQVGSCPQCGAPVYTESPWMSVSPPPSIRTCGCVSRGIGTMVTTGTNIPMQPINTGISSDEIRRVVREEMEAMKTKLFEEFEQELTKRIRLHSGVGGIA